jgi:hypothetical protein
MAIQRGTRQDACLDQYIDDENKVIVMALNKHGSSTLSNTIDQSDNNFQLAVRRDDYVADYQSLFSLNSKFDQYTKWITFRDFNDVWVSAFCYETRTSHFRALLDGDFNCVKDNVHSVIKAIGGVDKFISQDFEQMNGTYMSVCFATVFPSIADQLVEQCIPIECRYLPNFLTRFCSGVDEEARVNKTPDVDRQAIESVFSDLGIFDRLQEKYSNDYRFKESLKEKLGA